MSEPMTSSRDRTLNGPIASKSWPTHLSTPAELLNSLKERTKLRIVKSPLLSKIVLQIVGSSAYLLAHILNRSRIFNLDTFNEELRQVEHSSRLSKSTTTNGKLGLTNATSKDSMKPPAPLLTLSNHISCIDDPVLWASLLPLFYYSSNTDSVRWSAAAVDICFSRPWHSAFFSLGKTFPIVRGVGVNQLAMEFAVGLLRANQWLHLFPEGRVMRDESRRVLSNEPKGYKFKWGIAKIVLDYLNDQTKHNPLTLSTSMSEDKIIRILPFYHLGLDEILPVGWPYVPRIGKQITIFIKPNVIELNLKKLNAILRSRSLVSLKSIKSKSNDEIDMIKLTNFLEDEVQKLIEPTEKLHRDRET